MTAKPKENIKLLNKYVGKGNNINVFISKCNDLNTTESLIFKEIQRYFSDSEGIYLSNTLKLCSSTLFITIVNKNYIKESHDVCTVIGKEFHMALKLGVQNFISILVDTDVNDPKLCHTTAFFAKTFVNLGFWGANGF